MNKFKQLVDNNRSHREFAPSCRIDHEMLVDWVSNANHCPAAMNLQTLKYVIIDREDEVERTLAITRWAASLGKKLPPDGHGPSAFIAICHDNDVAPFRPVFMIDAGICAQTIMLSATEDGFGGCMIGSAAPEKISEVLGLSQNIQPLLLLALGRPEEKVVLTVAQNGNVTYYRDEQNVHYVPKREINEIIIKR